MTKILFNKENLDSKLHKIVWKDINSQGLCGVKLYNSVEYAFTHPVEFVEQILGQKVLRVVLDKVRPKKGESNFLATTEKADFHTDQDLFMMPPAIQMFVCVRSAKKGGESLFVDTWSILEKLKKNDKRLYKNLFDINRTFRYVTGHYFGPTFSINGQNLTCSHSAYNYEDDHIGHAFQKLVKNAPKIKLTLKPDCVLISNNHRMLHARNAFVGTDRFLIRFTIWPSKPLKAPKKYIKLANIHRDFTKKNLKKEPSWVKQRFGLEPAPKSKKLYYFDDPIPYVDDLSSEKKLETLFHVHMKLLSLNK